MSLKSSLLALAENIGMCQENARSIKQALAGGLVDVASDAPAISGASELVELWSNAEPTAAFDATDIEITNGDVYDMYLITARAQSGQCNLTFTVDSAVINDNNAYSLVYTHLVRSSGKVSHVFRTVTLTKAEGSHTVVFGFAKGRSSTLDTYGSEASTSDSNSSMIPEHIIGVKF